MCCDCHTSKYYGPVRHVATRDLNDIKDAKLRPLIKKGHQQRAELYVDWRMTEKLGESIIVSGQAGRK